MTNAATQEKTTSEHLHIFVNQLKFTDGITNPMSVDAIAHLVGQSADTSVVRRQMNGKAGEPLTGSVEVHQADHFVVEVAPVKLHIFVNRRKFDDGISPVMTVDAIARLVNMTAATATVRRLIHDKPGDPLTGSVEIHQADQFTATRNAVQGGHEAPSRIKAELEKLNESGQRTTFIASPPAVIFHDLPATASNAPITATDVLVPVAPGYPGAMLDLAFLPEGSPLIGRVQGSPQGTIHAGGRSWRQISYHPHNGGGGPPWNPNVHGFHTYVDELLTWLGRLR